MISAFFFVTGFSCRRLRRTLLQMITPQNSPLWAKRFQLEQCIRQFFIKNSFLEVRTPLLVQSPGMEPHIWPIALSSPNGKQAFLPTSPEFGMKKLLAQHPVPMFQICPAFRHEPHSPHHRPEFTLLEFYEPHTELTGLLQTTQNLFLALNQDFPVFGLFQLQFPRYTVNHLFTQGTGTDLREVQNPTEMAKLVRKFKHPVTDQDSWDDLFFKLWLNHVEPHFSPNPFFVTHFPLSQSSLCETIADEQGFLWGNRFEVFAQGLELGNAFQELVEPETQKKNFIRDQAERKRAYGSTRPESPIDETFLSAIAAMPRTSGIAIGVDRLAMVFLNAKTIGEVVPLRSFWEE